MASSRAEKVFVGSSNGENTTEGDMHVDAQEEGHEMEYKIYEDCDYTQRIPTCEKAETAHSDGKMDNSAGGSPCAGCKIQKKKCSEKCVLAPFFPNDDPRKFLLVKRVFGNAHVIKLLQDLPAEHRGDAVRSMVYEAKQRLRDPVHGSLGVINDLEKRIAELQSKLASIEAEAFKINVEYDNLVTLLKRIHEDCDPLFYDASLQESEDVDVNEVWERLWT